jgi:hypothetical protein
VSTIIFFVVMPIICAGVCYSVAKKRNAAVPFWVVMGALFGPFALPFVFMSKPKNNQV